MEEKSNRGLQGPSPRTVATMLTVYRTEKSDVQTIAAGSTRRYAAPAAALGGRGWERGQLGLEWIKDRVSADQNTCL